MGAKISKDEVLVQEIIEVAPKKQSKLDVVEAAKLIEPTATPPTEHSHTWYQNLRIGNYCGACGVVPPKCSKCNRANYYLEPFCTNCGSRQEVIK